MRAVLAMMLAVVAAAPARAQVPVLGVAGGLSVPTSRFGRPLDLGYDFQASADFRPVPGPIAFRGDILWSRFAVSDPGVGSSNVVGGTFDVVIDVPTPGIAPYAIGGVGVYDVEVGGGGSHHSRLGTGLNIGGGVRFPLVPLLHGFIEVRYHVAYASPFGGNTTFVPILFGVRLR
jgi:Outer membrane protein beta-barrel domain